MVKEGNGDRMGIWGCGIVVPEFSDEQAVRVSLIWPIKMEKVPTKNVGSGAFVMGETKLTYPHLDGADGKPESFKHDQRMSLWIRL